MHIWSIILEPGDSSGDGHLNRKGSNSVHELTKSLVDDIRSQPVKQKIVILNTESTASRDGGAIVVNSLMSSEFKVDEYLLSGYKDIDALSLMINRHSNKADLTIVVTDDPMFNGYLESCPTLRHNEGNKERATHKRSRGRLSPSHAFSG